MIGVMANVTYEARIAPEWVARTWLTMTVFVPVRASVSHTCPAASAFTPAPHGLPLPTTCTRKD